MRHFAHHIFTIVLALLCALVSVATADSPGPLSLRFIDVLGRVTGPGGTGIEGVTVSLDRSPEISSTTDAAGGYTLTLPLAALGDPARKGALARVVARRPGWAFTLRNGQSALALELRMVGKSDPPRCRIRANVMRSVDAIAAALRGGDANAVIANADFVGREGAPVNRVSLRSEAITVIGAAKEPASTASAEVGPPAPVSADATVPRFRPASAARDSALQASQAKRQTVVDAEPRTAKPESRVEPVRPAEPPVVVAQRPSTRPRIRRIDSHDRSRGEAPDTSAAAVVRLPGPGITQTDASLIHRFGTASGAAGAPGSPPALEQVLAQEGDCACRIRGTVEIHPDHLLTQRLDLIITLREAASVRDTIQLFMGSPRAFELPAVRCGTWHIDVDAVTRRGFSIVSADGRGPIDCREGGLHQLRVVLDPD